MALWCATIDSEHETFWDLVGCCSAYRYRIGEDAWRQFTAEFNIGADDLVRRNYCGRLLEMCSDNMRKRAPSAEDLRLLMQDQQETPEDLLTADDLAESWREMFVSACRE